MTDNFIVLASSSPRRAEILTALGIPFEVESADVDEALQSGEEAAQAASRLAQAKARKIASRRPNRWILGADTLVVLENTILGKPNDEEDAGRMLQLLAGREHLVVTGLALLHDGASPRVLLEESRVRMAPLTAEEVSWYVETREPMDKAGAYAVQGLGSRFIEEIRGSYTNVMGLPARAVYRLMREAGDPSLARLALSCP